MSDLSIVPLIAAAKAIATVAHKGQADKAGNPYIGHPARVVALLKNPRSDSTVAAAWLHDVLEDSELTRDDLFAAGIDWMTINIVEHLTHAPNESAEEYFERVTGSTEAVKVKLADIADNTDPNRLALLDDATIARLTRKYAKARMLLGATSD